MIHFISGNQLDLAQKTLHVVKGSPSILRIQNLGNEIGDTIYIKEIEKYGSEQLISLVAHGDIDYAVCDRKHCPCSGRFIASGRYQYRNQFYSILLMGSQQAITRIAR